MRYDERDDGELLELAQAGWAPAFAVLVHRHAPALLAAFADDPDPAERVTDVFTRAMRQLHERDPAAPVGPWLFALAGRPQPEATPPAAAATLDGIWRHLTLLWPDGRHVHHHRPRRRIARTVATVVGALALGVAVPTIVLGIPASPTEAPASVRAQPVEDEPTEEPEPEELPVFEFPDVGGDAGSQDAPTTGPADPVQEPASPGGTGSTPTDQTGGTPPSDGTDVPADGPTDGGATDEGATDGGGAATDGGTPPDGTSDSGDGVATDGGATDGGPTDGGATDAGGTDGAGGADGNGDDGAGDGTGGTDGGAEGEGTELPVIGGRG